MSEQPTGDFEVQSEETYKPVKVEDNLGSISDGIAEREEASKYNGKDASERADEEVKALEETLDIVTEDSVDHKFIDELITVSEDEGDPQPIDIVDIAEKIERANKSKAKPDPRNGRNGMTMAGFGKRNTGRKPLPNPKVINKRRGIHKVYPDKEVANVGKGTTLDNVNKLKVNKTE